MSTTTIDDELDEIGRRIDELEAQARVGAADARPRVRRQLAALRQEKASVRAAVRTAPEEVDDRLAQLQARLGVAEHSLAADVSADRGAFEAAVEAELHSWDDYFERLQTTAATRAAKAREQAEAAIRELRTSRLAVAERLDEADAGPADGWQEQKARVTAAREELERKADELSATLG
jgi:hypothetical protein